MKSFTLCRVSWLTQRPGGDYPLEWVVRQFWAVSDFLQRHNLTVRPLANSISDITNDFEIRSDDLTEEGLLLMRTGYRKWLRALDRGGDPSDTTILQKELAKQRDAS